MGVALMTAFGQSIGVLMLAIGLVYSPMYCRTTRAAVLPVRDQEYIEAARVAGVGDLGIMFNHVLPNALSPITSTPAILTVSRFLQNPNAP